MRSAGRRKGGGGNGPALRGCPGRQKRGGASGARAPRRRRKRAPPPGDPRSRPSRSSRRQLRRSQPYEEELRKDERKHDARQELACETGGPRRFRGAPARFESAQRRAKLGGVSNAAIAPPGDFGDALE